jgi:hydroxymethylpyrimidine/phosphomethylpyrimidine kinase
MSEQLPAALTIAGSDSSGGAGIQADLKTFAALGVYGTCAITAVTAQNTTGVTGVMPIPTDMIIAQIEAVVSDIPIRATKTGMLFSAAIVEAVAASVAALDLPLLVVDPVMLATSGDRLLDDDGVRALCAELLPQALVVTPNIPEAEVLAGRSIETLEEVRAAAQEIHQRSGAAIVIKGGHASESADGLLVDLLFDGERFTEYQTSRIQTRHTHGTGCSFAAALAAGLARGDSLLEAVAGAQAFVAGAIAHALPLGKGHEPLDHFWKFRTIQQ